MDWPQSKTNVVGSGQRQGCSCPLSILIGWKLLIWSAIVTLAVSDLDEAEISRRLQVLTADYALGKGISKTVSPLAHNSIEVGNRAQ